MYILEKEIEDLLRECNLLKSAISTGDLDKAGFICSSLSGGINGAQSREKQDEKEQAGY